MTTRGTRSDLQIALGEIAYDRIPAGILLVGLIVTVHGYRGWRGLVLRVALWAIGKAGHGVVEHDGWPTPGGGRS